MPEEKQSALNVKPGCATPQHQVAQSVVRRRSLSPEQYTAGILSGDRTILARAITLIESSREDDRQLSEQIVEDCLPHCGNSIRVGITGVPGAGKSSIIEALGSHLIRDCGQKVAVLAIDPSSQLSGGSILGDKTRMESLANNDLAFIRPSPSRGSLGGVAQHTREAMLLCEAAGYRNILVETVGVGQSETAVHEMVDFFLLITLAGAGDELQGIKRGIMELAHIVAINKADGSNTTAAENARRETENALHYLPRSASGWAPCAITCSAQTGRGIAELWQSVLAYVELTRANGWFNHVRQQQEHRWMHAMIRQELVQQFESHPAVRDRRAALELEVLEGRMTSFGAARSLLKTYWSAEAGESSR